MGDVWRVIRADYARRWEAVKPIGKKPRAHGATQAMVAAQGGLAGQNALSRILSNEKGGPTVEIFVRGLIGLGVKPSDFFRAIEDRLPIPVVEPAWARAANAAPTDGPRPADETLDVQRARLLKAGHYAQRLYELFAGRDAPRKKRQ
jgi:hypothetical protein